MRIAATLQRSRSSGLLSLEICCRALVRGIRHRNATLRGQHSILDIIFGRITGQASSVHCIATSIWIPLIALWVTTAALHYGQFVVLPGSPLPPHQSTGNPVFPANPDTPRSRIYESKNLPLPVAVVTLRFIDATSIKICFAAAWQLAA